MKNQSTHFFLKRPLLVNLITVIILLGGLTVASQLKRTTYPKVDFDVMKITTLMPGASPEDVEVEITKKIEDELYKVSGVDRIRSLSSENNSVIYVFMEPDNPDREEAKDEVRRTVDRITDLPDQVEQKPRVDELKSSNVAVMELSVRFRDQKVGAFDFKDEKLLRKVVTDLEDTILEVKGIESITKVGYRDREVHLYVDPAKLKNADLTLLDVGAALEAKNLRLAAGNIKSAGVGAESKVVTFGRFEKPTDIGHAIIRSNNTGEAVALKNIARVEEEYEDPLIKARTGGQSSINLLIRANSATDIIHMSDQIEEVLEDKNEHLKELGVEVSIIADFSYYTESLLNIVTNNAYIGILFVVGALMFFLGRYTALWTAIGIPFSVLGAFILFPQYDMSINFISLITMILVLGLIVDDAIVVAENITRHMEMGKGRFQAAVDGVQEMFWPVVATVVTSVLSFAPILFMSGVTGKFVQEIPKVVMLCLGLSLFECLFLLPTHILSSPLKGAPKLGAKFFKFLKKKYRLLLKYFLRHKVPAVGLGVLYFGLTGWVLVSGRAPIILFPYDDVDIFYVVAELPSSTPLEVTSQKMVPVEEILAGLPTGEVVDFSTAVGHHDTDVYGANKGPQENWAMISVYLKYSKDRTRNSNAIIEEIEQKLPAVKKAQGFTKLMVQKYNDGPPVGRPITLSLVSKDDELRAQVTERLFQFLKATPGVKGLEVDDPWGKTELRFIPREKEMARLGVDQFMLGQLLRTALEGQVMTSAVYEGEEVQFRLRLKKAQKIEDILKLSITNKSGRLIPLRELVKIKKVRGLDTLRHFNRKRATTIYGDVDEAITSSKIVNQLVRDKFEDEINSTLNLDLEFGGEEKATQESLASLMRAFIFAMISIYFVLVLLFQSFLHPFIIMTAIPSGLAGVVLTFYLKGMPLSFLAMIGCLGLMGIVVNDSLIMVSHLKKRQKERGRLDHNTVTSASMDRLRAVLLTTITTVSGMAPTLLGLGGSEPFIIPIVLSVTGGIIFATAITLVQIPMLYYFVEWCRLKLKFKS